MAFQVLVNNSPVNVQRLSVSLSQNNQDRLSADILSADGSFVPWIDSTIKLTEDGDPWFGGTIKDPTLSGYTDRVAGTQYKKTSVSCLDYNELGKRFPITITIPAGNLQSAATAVLAQLNAGLPGSLQVTLSMGSGGPALGELSYIDTYIDDILADLSTRSGWLRNINSNRVLSYWEPGTIGAPWSVADTNRNAHGDMIVKSSRIDYANQIIVKYWYTGMRAWGFLRSNGTVLDGEQVIIGAQTYTFKDTLTDEPGFILIGTDPIGNLNSALNLDGSPNYAPSTPANQAVTSYVSAPNTIKVQAANVGLSGNDIQVLSGTSHLIWFWEGNQPIIALAGGLDAGVANKTVRDNLAEQALYGRYTIIVEAANVFNLDDANSLGDALLTTSVVVQQTVTFYTYLSGIYPGMTMSIQRANRGVNGTFLITQIELVMQENRLYKTVTAVSGSTYKGDKWRDQYKKWSGNGTGASGITFSGSGGGGGSTTVWDRPIYFLGGSPDVWVRSEGPDWVTANTDSGVQYLIDTSLRGTTDATVTVQLRARSGSVTARLVNTDDGSVVGTSVAITSTSFQTTSFPVTLTPGAHTYRLELLPEIAGIEVNGVGYLR